MTATYNIAVLPGDGIGKEIMPEAERVLSAIERTCNLRFAYSHFDWGCERLVQTGELMPADGIQQLRRHDAILMGAVGWPSVPDYVSLWGLLIPIRRQFDQYVSLRPIHSHEGIRSPLREGGPDYYIVRENSEGEYSQIGGRYGRGSGETAVQVATFTQHGNERIMRFAFELAVRTGRNHVTSCTKSNGIYHTMPFWDECFRRIATEFPSVRTDEFHVDNLAAQLVLAPKQFDVIVASNLFGDILSDLGAGTVGSLGVAACANIDPSRSGPSMFEPVHGSAPDIAGRNIANPIGQILAAAMMLEHLGELEASQLVAGAVDGAIANQQGPKTPDIGGQATTSEVGKEIAGLVSGHA
jgi:tartrate dehydrogenase/decarboxylase/D-malate dehydrogenase